MRSATPLQALQSVSDEPDLETAPQPIVETGRYPIASAESGSRPIVSYIDDTIEWLGDGAPGVRSPEELMGRLVTDLCHAGIPLECHADIPLELAVEHEELTFRCHDVECDFEAIYRVENRTDAREACPT
jgi:hypothetical protein